MIFTALASCKKDPPAPAPNPDAWLVEATKLKPYLPPVLGPCSSTASVETAHYVPDAGGSTYVASRKYDCGGRSLTMALHGGNLSGYNDIVIGPIRTAVETGVSDYKDVMIGGGRGLVAEPNRGVGTLYLYLRQGIVVTAELQSPTPPDEMVPIVNKLDFKGLSTIDPHQVP